VAEDHSFVRVPALALMTRRLRLAPAGVSTPAAGRFVRDICRSWGVPEDLVGEAAAVVRALVEGAAPSGGTGLDLVVEARSHTVTVRLRDRDKSYQPRAAAHSRRADRPGDCDAKPWTAGAWTFVSSGDSDEVWAVVPRDRHPAPGSGR
jgi:hypothetical protein